MMDNIEKCKSLLEKLRATETLESRMDILQELSNEEQFELDTYLCYGERGVEGTVCFPYRNGKYFNQKPTEKAPWIKNRFRDLNNLSIESVQKYDNYRTLNILNPGSTERRKEYFHYINEMYIDLDSVHKDGIPESEQTRLLKLLYDFLLAAFDNDALPRPTSFLFSGRGFALHYVLKEPIPVDSKEAINFSALYQCAFDKLEHLLETGASESGTDVDRVVHGISRMGRVAGTLNSKAKRFSRFIDITGHYFSMDELVAGFVDNLEDFEIRKALKRSEKGITKAAMVKYYAKLESKSLKGQKLSEKTLAKITEAKHKESQYEASADALSDQQLSQWCHIALYGMWHLDQLLSYRKWVDGSGRYKYGLIYYNLARTLYDPDQAEYFLRRNVEKMEEPLDENAIERIIEGTEDVILKMGFPLRYSYDKICETLDIEPEIAEKCGLVSVNVRAKKTEENINAAAERDKAIMRMHDEGVSAGQIAKILKNEHPEWHICSRTVDRTIAKFKGTDIQSLNRTIYVVHNRKNVYLSTADTCACAGDAKVRQHSSNEEIKDSIKGALVGPKASQDSILTELNSENPINEKSDNEFKKYILSVLKNRENVFLHGMGGTGKTYLLKLFIEYCNQANRSVAVVAPTAVAATNYEQSATIHSFFHFNTGIIEENSVNLMQIHTLENVDVLIIDELSMVRCDLFDTILYTIAEAERLYKKKIQLILCGDVGQLPCVVTDDETTWLVHKYDSLHYMFFKAKRYQSLPMKHFLLEKNRRTNAGESLYAKIMRHIHDGDTRVLSLLDDRVISEQLTPTEGILVLAAHRATVNQINNNTISKHMTDPSFQNMNATGASDASEGEYPVPLQLPVFEGMKIMFVSNKLKRGYVNGTMAEIVSIQTDSITVLINGKQLNVKREQFMSGIDKTKSIKQFPFVPAYAITIHKSQGLSLDQALIYPDCFASGMLYTALSRLRSMDGLYLASSISEKSLLTCSEATEYMQHLNLITAENYESEHGMH